MLSYTYSQQFPVRSVVGVWSAYGQYSTMLKQSETSLPLENVTSGSEAQDDYIHTKDASRFARSLESIGFDSFIEDESRHEALTAARKLVRRLETPLETVWAVSFDTPALYAALRAAHDNNIFERLDENNGSLKSTIELAGTAESALIHRIVRHLAAMDIVVQAGPEHWIATRHSTSLRNPDIFAVAEYASQVTFESFRTLPKFWRSASYRPPDSIKGSWQHLIGSNQLFYDWIVDRPEVQECFSNLIKGYVSSHGSWINVYPTDDIMATAKEDGPLLVDLGETPNLHITGPI